MPPARLKSTKFIGLVLKPSDCSWRLRPSAALSVRLPLPADDATTPGILAALIAATRDVSSLIVPVTATPLMRKLFPDKSPNPLTERDSVVVGRAATPVDASASLITAAMATALAA